MVKTCYLHLGFHKTATTSFQLTLQHNRKLLEQGGIFLPKFEGKKKKFSSNHSGQIRDIFDENAQLFWNSHNRFKPTTDKHSNSLHNHCHSLKQLLEQDQNILISGEGISTMSEKSLSRLKSKLEQHGFLIEPFALVRSPYAYITSALQQTIKNGKYHPWISFIPAQSSASHEFVKIPKSTKSIRVLNRVFGKKINYIPFKKATNYPGGPVLFLLQEVLRLQDSDQYQLINANESKSNVSTRLQNFLNQQHTHADQRKLKNLLTTISGQSEQAKFLLTKQEFNGIKDDFKQIKREMKQKLGKQFVEETITFSSEFSAAETNQLLSQLSQKLYEFAIEK